MKLGVKFSGAIALVCLVTLGGAAWLLVKHQQEGVLAQAAQRARTVLSFGTACREYTRQVLSPAVRRHTDDLILEANSATFVARGTFDQMRKEIPEYSFREAARNPLNEVNRADADEEEIIRHFEADPGLAEISGLRSRDGQEQFYVARPIPIGRACLECHGSPQTAPPALVARYGSQHGFGWREGDLAGAVLVTVPTNDLQAERRAIFWKMVGFFGATAVLLSVSSAFLFHAVVTRRLLRAGQVMRRIATDPHIPERLNASSPDEIGAMAVAFNAMADSLGQSQRLLEQRVTERTAALTQEVAERQKVAERLQDSEAGFRAVVETAPDSIITIDHEERITEFNPAAERTFGFARSDVLGRPLSAFLIPPGLRSKYDRGVKQYLKAKDSSVSGRRLEVPALRADGREIFVELSLSALHRQGSPTFTAYVRDITERRRAQQHEALQHRVTDILARSESLAGALPVILQAVCETLDWVGGEFWLWDNEAALLRRTEAFHKAAAAVAGHHPLASPAALAPDEGLPGRVWRSRKAEWLVDESGAGAALACPLELGEKGWGVLVLYPSRAAAPDPDLLSRMQPLCIQLGHFLETTRTMGVRKRLAAILEATTDFVYSAEPNGRVVYANGAFRRVIGMGEGETFRRAPGIAGGERFRRTEAMDLYPPWAAKRIETEAIPAALRDGVWAGETAVWTRDDREIPVSQVIIAHCGPDGRAEYLSSVMRDISGQKEAQAELVRAKEVAESANRSKSEFLANVSHELRTPLNGILGMAELALDTPVNAEQHEYLQTVKSSGESLLTVINDLLDFSKMEAGKLSIDLVEFKLRDGLGEALKLLAFRAHDKGLELACRVAPDVPDALVGDIHRLRQVVVNLVGNAIKFTEAGEVVLRVHLEAQAADEVRLHFAVSDTGIGIDASKHELIFSPFEQADGSTTRKYGGTGLGLTISARLVGLMGGEIWVESAVGCGSTFHFTARLRLQRGTASQLRPARPEALRGLPVLVVDDNGTNRRILQEMLLNWGMHPVVADQAEAALAELRRAAAAGSRYRVALIDAMMPGMDGFELSRAIQTRPELGSPAVLMLSSGDRQDGMVRSRAVGVAYYLSKPVLQSELQAALLSALGGVSVNRERMSGILSDGASGPWTPVARPLNVLVAEDNAVNQKLFQRMLAKRGYLVTTVTSGVEVLAAVERQKFDLVLMDVQMPEMSGLEATERIRALELGTGRHLPIVALTAHAMTGDRERCLKAGMDGYISKPVQLRELFEMIDRVMTPAPSEEVPLPPAPVRVQASLDRAAVLARLDGDEELLRELVDLFLDDTPRLLAEARDAIAVGDSVRLQRAAHTIKGSVGNFGAEAVVNAAWHLESLARTTSLAEAPAGLERLAQLLEEVGPKLRQLALPKGAPLPSPELAGRAPGTNGSACRDK